MKLLRESLQVILLRPEANMGPEDRAAHSYGNRRTKRTEIMFGEAGICLYI